MRSFRQIETQELFNLNFDIIIVASGYEKRAPFIARQIKCNKAKKFAFAFSDNKDKYNRYENDQTFISLGFELVEIKGSNFQKIIDYLENFILGSEKSELSILIDYSSMTRIWYGAIIYYLSNTNHKDKNLKVFFAYSESCFYSPHEIEPESINFSPINFFCNLSIPSKPTALIIGLGNEKRRAFGLRDYFDAEALFVFYSENSEFTQQVLEKNSEVLKSVKDENIYPYIVNELMFTKTILDDLCKELQNGFRIVIAPCGPKPFTFLSFIVASIHKNIDVWRISASDENDKIVDKPANGTIITAVVDFI
jgi:hypothetical protein